MLALLIYPGLAACAWAGWPMAGRDAEEEQLRKEMEAAALEAIAKGLPAGPGFANPGFEVLAGVANPAPWRRNNIPDVPSETLGDGSTNRFARDSRSHFYSQTIPFPGSAWQTATIGARVRSELGEGTPTFEMQSLGGGVATSFRRVTRGPTPPGIWVPQVGSVTRLPGHTSLNLNLSSLPEMAWLDYDDVYILTEEPLGGDFESGGAGEPDRDRWALLAGAELATTQTLRGAGSLALPPGGGATRLVAHSPFVVEYFVTGVASGAVVVEEQRLDSSLETTDGTTSATLAPNDSGRFLLRLPQSATAEAARIRVSNAGPVSVLVDDVSRGWSYVYPAIAEPVANSPRPAMRLAAAWPGRLEGIEAAILDGGGLEVLRLGDFQRDGASAWREFDGAPLAAGVYTARFLLTDAGGETVALDHVFEVRRPEVYAPRPTGIRRPEFTRVAWLWLFPFTPLDVISTVEEMEARFRPPKEDGFNMLLVSCRADQYDLVRQAAERVGINFMIFDGEIPAPLFDQHGNRTWDPSRIEVLMGRLSAFEGSDRFQGLYLVDEPNGNSTTLLRAVDTVRLIERLPNAPPCYVFMNPGSSIEGGDFPITGTFEYPVRVQATTAAEQIAIRMARLEPHAEYAVELGRDYWMGVQGYGGSENISIMTPAECHAMLAHVLAYGARGYFVFLYSSLGDNSSLRLHNYEAAPRMEAFREFNARVAALEGLLLSFEPGRETPEQNADILARIARTPDRDVYTIVASRDPEGPTEFDAVTPAPTRMTNVETGEATALSTTHTMTLGPGQWGIFRFENQVAPIRFEGRPAPSAEDARAPVRVVARLTPGVDIRWPALDRTGEYLAGVVGTEFRVFDLRPENLGAEIHREYFDMGNGLVRFVAPRTLGAFSRRVGTHRYQIAGTTLTRFFGWTRKSGAAADSLSGGDGTEWLAQNFWGVSLVESLPATFGERLGYTPADERNIRQLFGPFEDGSVLAVEDVRGLYRVRRADGGGIEKESLMPRGVYGRAAMTEGGRLAVSELGNGVHVFDFAPDGEIIRQFIVRDPRLVHATDTAWIAEDTLAVIDARAGIRFYRVYESGTWTALGLWRPADPPFAITGMDWLPDGRLAVVIAGNEILLLDASPVTGTGKYTGWVMD